MKTVIDRKTYIQRRKALCDAVGEGVILLLGNNESPMNYADNGYHFRQDSTFLYYFGIDVPDLFALIDIDNQQKIIFGNDYTIDDIVWMGAQPTIAERASLSGVSETRPLKDGIKLLENIRIHKRKIHYLPPYRAEHRLFLSEVLGIKIADLQKNESVKLIRTVVSQREVKSAEELSEIEKAVDTSVDMHVAAMRMATPGMTEAAIAARVHEIALAAGGELSFPIIATINGQTLHNHYHGNILKSGDLFLLDAGAETAMHYAGDLSSTFPVDKRFTEQQKMIYEMSLTAHRAAVSTLAVGVPFCEVHLAACRSIAESLKSIHLLKGNVDDIVSNGAHALFMPCGTGHLMGLDVHDMENLGEVWTGYDGEAKSTQFGLKSLRLAKPLKPGHVFTIEPGIYFIPELMDKWRGEGKFSDFVCWAEVEKFRHFGGIRNEEDYCISENGDAQRIGKPKPMTVAEVEDIRMGG